MVEARIELRCAVADDKRDLFVDVGPVGPNVVAGQRYVMRAQVSSLGGCSVSAASGDAYAGGAGLTYLGDDTVAPEAPYDYGFQLLVER